MTQHTNQLRPSLLPYALTFVIMIRDHWGEGHPWAGRELGKLERQLQTAYEARRGVAIGLIVER